MQIIHTVYYVNFYCLAIFNTHSTILNALISPNWKKEEKQHKKEKKTGIIIIIIKKKLKEQEAKRGKRILNNQLLMFRRYSRGNGYRRWAGTRCPEFKFWSRPFAFHIALILSGKGMNPTISLHLWVNSRTDLAINVAMANIIGEGKLWMHAS